MHCQSPPNVKQGFVEVNNFRGVYVFGTEAKYSCNPGHVLKGGSEVRTCNHKGTWSGQTPTCEGKSKGKNVSFFALFTHKYLCYI